MDYNFDEVLERHKTLSVKYEAVEEQVIPMWVADMDFETAPEIKEAIISRGSHGAYGYVQLPEDYYQCQLKWWEKRHKFIIEKEWIEFCTGVIPSLSASVAALVKPGEKVVIQTPVYNYFNTSIVNNGCIIIESELKYINNRYEMDFESFEDLVSPEDVKMFILCNPHNPVGRAWTKEELYQIGMICKKHQVIVVSDEIHGDLILNGGQHIPFISVDPEFLNMSITCTAPSKTFNLAGLKNANMIIPNPEIKKKVNRASNDKEVAESNIFGAVALMAAYNEGEQWLNELLEYLNDNRKYISDFISKYMPHVKLVDSEATYLAWIDCSYYGLTSKQLMDELTEFGVRVSAGSQFGTLGDGFIRVNFACPKVILQEGLKRIYEGLNSLETN